MCLALDLFKAAFAGLDAIAAEAAKAFDQAHEAARLAGARRKPDPEDLSFQKDPGRFELSATGKALERQAAQDSKS
jgi:hypothetical protein